MSIKRYLEKFIKKEDPSRYFFAKAFLGLAASTLILIFFISHAFDKFELVTLDQRFKLRPGRAVSNDIVLIEMADDSIEAIGRWPWPREWHATLLSVLKEYGAKAVLFDVIFDNESGHAHDAVFEEAIRRAGNVYLPYVFQFKTGDMPDEARPDANIRNVISPLKRFLNASKGSGHVNVAPDIDGVLRRSPLAIEYKGRYHFQIAFKAIIDYLGINEDDIIIRPGKYIILRSPSPYPLPATRGEGIKKKGGDIKIPVDKDNQMLVSWAGPWKKTFKHYSYIDIITSHGMSLKNERPIMDLTQLKDKICIVGLTAAGLYDIRPIPLEPAYPVVGMNANIMNNILMKDFIKEPPEIVDILLIYIMGLATALLVSKARFIRGAAYTFATAAGYLFAAFAAFSLWGRWIGIVYPAAAMFGSFLCVTVYNEVVLALERKVYFDLSIRDGLTKLFNIRHFKEILEREFAVSSGKRRSRKLCLIMADVDYFKSFNDKYGHQVGDFVLKRVARIFKEGSRANDVVARYGGEEFIMMLPGADIEDAKHIAERIRQKTENTPLKRSNEVYNVTISLGVAMLEDETNKEGLIKKADEALYMAKREGRNRVCWKEKLSFNTNFHE